ncbi:MAG: hypothetical protein RL172_1031 [Bacteroidota bacterium]
MLNLLLQVKKIIHIVAFFFATLFSSSIMYAAAPPNDSCGGALPIVIGGGGFAVGIFTSTNIDITEATLQTGETFAPSITVAGLTKKSVWYKFSIPTTRSVRVSLLQPGSAIQAGNVGFTIYKTKNCLPGNADISTKLSPIETFGNTFHPCVDVGDYLVQVTSNNSANGPIYITVETGEPAPAPYDKPATASKFGKVSTNKTTAIDFDISCQSLDDAAEVCLPTTAFKDYTKSTWHTFTTPDAFDFFAILISGNQSNSGWVYNNKIGFRLFEGDITSTALASLVQIGGCDSMYWKGEVADKKMFSCGQLKNNTTYTVQFLYEKDFAKTMRFAVSWDGGIPTRAPEPTSGIPAANKIGVLPSSFAGVTTYATPDNFSCNAYHNNYNCPKTLPVAGLPTKPSGYSVNLNLSTFYSFTLANTAQLDVYTSANCGFNYVRLYKQSLTGNCADLDTANIVATGVGDGGYFTLECMPPGDYVLQVMGTDNYPFGTSYSELVTAYNGNSGLCLWGNLGKQVTVRLTTTTQVGINKFSLNAPGAFEKINANGAGVMQPVQLYNKYTTTPDTLGCSNTVLPADNCGVGDQKASYREFVLGDSAIFRLDENTFNWTSLYKGDANALAASQNAYSFPKLITGLETMRKCMIWHTVGTASTTCITPGTFSLVSFGPLRGGYSNSYIVQNPSFTVIAPKTNHNSPQTAQDMGDLWAQLGPSGGFIRSDIDTFSCYDNPAVIDGFDGGTCWGPYKPTKLIYRQFYLSQPTNLRIATGPYGYTGYYGYLTLYSGKVTDGTAGLKIVGDSWKCFYDKSNQGSCTDLLPAGWYSVVAYGYGGSYENPLQTTDANGSHYSMLGQGNAFYIYLYPKTCASPQFNRPYKASVDTVTKNPYLIEWGPQTGHTAAYPVTSKKYTLNTENFDCTQDTAFISQYIKSCNPVVTSKIAFYVFKITQESYIQIDGIDDGLWSSVYAFDVRTADSAKLKTDAPLQTCTYKKGVMEFCKLQPGTYSIVFYAQEAYTCNAVTPTIYIDQVGYSRFDHAGKAYDFGEIKPDSTWYSGKPGDINPLNSSRAASNDFFYCTTGAQEKDPSGAVCYTAYNPLIYTAGNNVVLHPDVATAPNTYTIDRRNVWYTFTVSQPGNIKLKVENKTPGKTHQYPYAIYKSDVDATIPFTDVIANGQTDSTLLQGLTFVAANWYPYNYYCQGATEITVYNEPCDFKPTRYYLLVENRNPYGYAGVYDMNPNSQVEVSILLDSLNALPPKFDHFSQANDMGLVNSGIKTGAVDNFTCATKDLPDPLYAYPNCQKTLWYKFTTSTTGQIRYAAFINNINNYYYDQIQLFRQIKPNDSSASGLQHMPHTSTYYNNGYWAQQCISPGTYYIILPGCNAINQDAYPQIEIIPQAGDFCSAPMITSLTGAGSKVVPVTVDCHTIGTDYGEFNPTLTCPANGITSNYKTSWYRLDITGTDTLDVTVYIDEKTNASSTDIKYRMMTGTCGAMQEQSCVQDALTRNTYKCLAPGNSYYIQVFTPTMLNSYTPVIGDIDLNIQAVTHADTCLPASTCIGVANFTPQFDCTKDKYVTFTNFSTYGSSIEYKWDFGYNNQTSTAVSPQFFYPALTIDKTYTVKLVITNSLCGKKDSVTQTINIPARPGVNLGNDTIICNSAATLLLDATSHPGSTYYWYNGSALPTFTVGGIASPYVEVTYNGCKAKDTINVFINPIAKQPLQTKALCAVTQVTLDAARGYGEQYKWSTGAISSAITVAQPGYYWVDIYLSGCYVRDSFLVVSTSLRPLGNDTTICQKAMPYTANATVSGATAYTWQNSSSSSTFSVSQPGTYWVDINLGGCTFRDSLTVAVDSFKTAIKTARICEGQNYILPSGRIVTTAGNYSDSLKNNRGCDSIITSLTLAVDTVKRVTKVVSVCAGQNYTLPSGTIISVAGNYIDTVKNIRSCDSIITTLNLSVTVVSNVSANAVICSGQSYALPSGRVVSTAGIYIDSVKAVAGCDSLITTTSLDVLTAIQNNISVNICSGQTYTLPNGSMVSAAGIYRDTLRYANGCDSLIRSVTINLNPKPSLGSDKTMAICFGNTANLTTQFNTTGLTTVWSLSGATVAAPTAVSSAGVYQLIASNSSNCADTALLTLTVSPKPDLGPDKALSTFSGNTINLTTQFNTTGLTTNWTLNGIPVPNPAAVSIGGTYQLVASNNNGCSDTALFTLTVSPRPDLGPDKSIGICLGASIDLTTQFSTIGLTSSWTMGGIPVTNPLVVSTAGIYQLIVTNTLGYADTALLTLSINPKPFVGADKTATLCAGNSFNLTSQFNTTGLTSNWTINGAMVSTPTAVTTSGVYQLIVTNNDGCKDTATITLTVNPKPILGADKAISICQGNAADLTAQFTTTGLTTNWTIDGSTVSNPSFITAAGIYQLIATNSSNCSDTALLTLTISPKPNLGIDKSINACAGNTVNLDAQFTSTGLTTSWSNNGLAVGNPAAVSNAGIYQIIASSTFGCKDTAQLIIIIAPKPNLGADKTVAICVGNTVNLTTQFAITNLTSNWTLGGAAVVTPTAVTQSGIYQLIAANTDGCTDTALVTVTFNPSPLLGIDKAVSFCEGASINLTSVFVTTGLQTSWTLNGSVVTTPTAVAATGIYQLVVTNNFTCTDTALVEVSINPLPVVAVSNPVPVCSPSTVNLTAAAVTAGSTVGLNYTYWQDAAASTSYPTPATASTGLYYIKGTDANNCSTIAPVNVLVYQMPLVNAGSDTIICYQDSAVLHGNASNTSIATLSYAWTPVAGLTNAGATTTIAKPLTTTEYSFTVTANYGVCSLTATDKILVTMQPPVPAFAGNDTNAVLGLPHQLMATGGVSYLWTPSAVLNNPFTQSPLATINRDTRFTVLVTDIAGCKDTASVLLRVYQGIRYFVPNAFSPNGDGLNEIFRPIAVGVVSTEWFRVYNRYGQVMYESSNIQNGWDGTYKGQRQPIGNYIWSIKGKGRDGKVIEMKGNVVLVR